MKTNIPSCRRLSTLVDAWMVPHFHGMASRVLARHTPSPFVRHQPSPPAGEKLEEIATRACRRLSMLGWCQIFTARHRVSPRAFRAIACHRPSQPVAARHSPSQPVTARHILSQPVTACYELGDQIKNTSRHLLSPAITGYHRASKVGG